VEKVFVLLGSSLRLTSSRNKLLMLSIRPATIDDVGLLAAMIRELAEFERELKLVVTTEADLARDGFGSNPKFRALMAEWDGQPAGYALFFDFYSTWRGRQLYLEDLFVRPQFRNRGIGKRLLAAVARIARDNDCHGMRWEVLDWNDTAIEFYKSLGAQFLDDWRLVLLKDEELERLAKIS
jgi:GNAT superfamily N-acetyltransferase